VKSTARFSPIAGVCMRIQSRADGDDGDGDGDGVGDGNYST
jgi:hypothetical protein